ncbi:hypothetical protein C0585_06825 [Candidatus Woesearchaeota archaeon]|nr:MAG: hypothetical protein C0585_06825 [Candidatus Woesearchaeota archaeon]
MNKKQAIELLTQYEDLIIGLSNKLNWLLKKDNSKKYQFAVMKDMHIRTIEKLELLHEELLSHAKDK